MKTDYQKYLEQMDMIQKQEKKPTLLLHSCCGPCSSYVLECLSSFFDITVLYYNPNIYPEEEYIRRRDELQRFLNEIGIMKFVELPYRKESFDEAVFGLENLGERSERCYQCYSFRMREAAEYANSHHFDYFTTTLSISPYKNSHFINEIGKKLEEKYSVSYLYSDFKKKGGYQRSLVLSQLHHLYRQDYCGCIYSKIERERHLQK